MSTPQTDHRQPHRLPGGVIHDLPSWIPLVLAVGGDFAVLYAILELVLGSYPELTMLATLATTAIAVALAHAVGVQWVMLRCGDTRASRALLGIAALGYLAIGAMAFLLRISTPLDTRASTGGFGGAATEPAVSHELTSGLFFLALFLASGAFAIGFAYHHHNPDVRAYRLARAAWLKMHKRAGASRAELARAQSVYEQQLEERKREQDRFAAARNQVLAGAAELKNEARVLMAAAKADPSATDGIIGSGPRPLEATP